MKRSLKTMLISGIASLLTATILFVSGGSSIIITILGGAGICIIPGSIHLNNIAQNELRKKQIKQFLQEINYSQNSDKFICRDKQSELYGKEIYLDNNKKYEFENEKTTQLTEEIKIEHDLIYELITTPAVSQEENINRLVRKRKKEPINKLNQNNI